MEQKVSISELQKLEFKQAFQEFDKVCHLNMRKEVKIPYIIYTL